MIDLKSVIFETKKNDYMRKKINNMKKITIFVIQ